MTHEKKHTNENRDLNPFSHGVYKSRAKHSDTKCVKFKSKSASIREIKDEFLIYDCKYFGEMTY